MIEQSHQIPIKKSPLQKKLLEVRQVWGNFGNEAKEFRERQFPEMFRKGSMFVPYLDQKRNDYGRFTERFLNSLNKGVNHLHY